MNVHSVEFCLDEKRAQQCQLHYAEQSICRCSESSSHRACHKERMRRIIGPLVLLALTVGALLALSCLADMDILGLLGVSDGSGISLGKRQTSSSFTQNKLYLIIIFVGLFLVLVAAILLSFWCCRGAFANPLCCPCYLCACCGGLACLECIGCGLCAAGLEEAV
ncbi:hypothetical protein F5I97DRAFT_1807396 [Phlebopus sp. FC_14]|nr:hypothetical protein F5I97DRAFT_1807396 [Phlebopus sp. FC_14]